MGMKKSKVTPDVVRDPPKGEYQCPDQHSVLPARSFGDVRFNQYPMTYRVLGVCSSHASSYSGTFFVNQIGGWTLYLITNAAICIAT